MSGSFVHLRLHTEYSLIDSVVRVPELMGAVAGQRMAAVALTDHCNLFAMVKFYREALQQGVQPLIGCDLLLAEPDDKVRPVRVAMLCQNALGYRNLAQLVSRAFLEGQARGEPLVERSWLTPQSTAGLIALSCAAEGDVGRALLNGRTAQAVQALDFWLALFGDRFYLELQRIGRPEEAAYLPAALELAVSQGVPVVATNDVRFLRAEEFEVHEARVCIHEGTQLADAARPRRYTPQQYLRSAAEMQALFADLPEALANSVEIARRCSLRLTLGESRLPRFPVPGGGSPDEFIREQARSGLDWRAQQLSLDPASRERYSQRLELELGVICPMGFSGYFLIVADFIRWARDNGVPVGPGRGSGAGSLVAFALGITDIDPLRYDLLFERFLNPERVSMPDFDVDFCMEGRDRVIEYVADRYGHERVSQIITYGTMAAKAVVRDVGRVLGHPYGFVDRIAKLIPFELGITLDDALEKEAELKRLYKEDEEVHNLLDLARALEGLTRNAGKHAGGVVIAPSVLTDFAPLYCEPGGQNVVTQFDKDDVEAAGLVKFDFLGLRTLTVIDWTVKSINARRLLDGEPPLDISRIPLDDAFTYDRVFKKAQTVAIFQFESTGMQRMLKDAKSDRFEDIIALGALYRPGPMELIPEYVACKHGKKPEYLHPDMEQVLGVTYGVFVYQEQVMQIAQRLAGYTLGGADLLRRAMGKKKPEEMAKQRGVFVAGAAQRGIDEKIANAIFDQMEKFAGYGFNKSHAAAYALLSYQTAYLKAHFPAAFMAAMLSADMDHTDKIVTLIDECAAIGLTVEPPSVNSADYAFAVGDARTIRYGLGAIKGVGRAAVEAIVEERAAHGPFRGLYDLCRRVDGARVNRRVFEALIRSGSMDTLGPNRATLMESLGEALQAAEQHARTHAAGQVDFFGLAAGAVPAAGDVLAHGIGGDQGGGGQPRPEPLRLAPAWNASVRLAGERETLGLYLSGHPIAPFEPDLRYFASGRIGDYAAERPSPDTGRSYTQARTLTLAGLVLEVRRRGTRVSFVLDDRSGRMEVTLYEDVFQRHRELIVKDTLVQVEGALRFDEFSDAWRLAARSVQSLPSVRERLARQLHLNWPLTAAADAQRSLARLQALLMEHRGGGCAVLLRCVGATARGTLTLGPAWNVRPTVALLEALEQLLGPGCLRLTYSLAPAGGSVAMG